MSLFLQDWKIQFSGYSRNIRLFFWFNFVLNLGLGMFGLDYNLYIKALGFTQTTLGNIVGMTALASAIILIPAGIMNDKIGPKKVISFGLIMAIGVLIARTFFVGEQPLLITAFLGGMSLAIVSATILPFMANNSTPPQRIHLFSFNLALVMFANVIGIALGGWFVDFFQFTIGFTEIFSFRITLLIGTGIAFLGIIPVLMFKADEQEKQSLQKPLKWKQQWKYHKTSFQVIAVFALLGLLSSIAGGMIVPYLNVYFEDRFLASKTEIGAIVALGQGATAIAYLMGPMFARRFGEVKSIIVLQMVSIPFLLITAYSANFYLACGGYLFRQAFMNAATPFYSSVKMKYVDRSLRGFASSSGEAVFHLGWFIAAPISTSLVMKHGAYFGYAYAFSITAVGYTLISLLFYLFFGKERFKAAE
ncbi:MFS transporter [Paenibacillus psychroresistens]|uniref:MFS transporter n=1 Tax=Paenibacillus psychroresistens TaxID=1778678 RepID=A0A6B8RUH3_9BACL|nr:MFS transporter [Paenibacillus psychroresistens]QGQ99414.1 MFS transporter [Paenibacillus psychroresistens]